MTDALLTGYDAIPEGVPFLPAGATWYAGYVDGLYISFPLIVQRFPGSVVLAITTQGSAIARRDLLTPRLILDCETGNPLGPDDVETWVGQQLGLGWTIGELGVYADASVWETMPPLRILGDGRWVAAYPGAGATVPLGFGAHQWSDRGGPDLGGGNFAYDCNVALSGFLNSATPIPTPPPIPEDVTMIQTYETADHRVGIVVEKDSTGEVLHIEQQNPSGNPEGKDADFWRNPDGSANWLSLGVPA